MLTSIPQLVQAGRMDLEKCGSTGVWGELLPASRNPGVGREAWAAIRFRLCYWDRKSCLRTRRGGTCLALGPDVRGWRWSGFTPAGADQVSASPSCSRTRCLPFHRPLGALPAFPLPHVSVPSQNPEGCFQGPAGQSCTALSPGRTRALTSLV